MGFRYSILETTVEQIRILLSSKVRQFKSKDLFATLDVADILSACGRRGLDRSFLEACKDNLKERSFRKRNFYCIQPEYSSTL